MKLGIRFAAFLTWPIPLPSAYAPVNFVSSIFSRIRVEATVVLVDRVNLAVFYDGRRF